ncbi:MAG: hypothetical protein HZA17_14250 [Nitrospirae bacterium]|nr:hypothetical protein [Nitrospirota bacterium]
MRYGMERKAGQDMFAHSRPDKLGTPVAFSASPAASDTVKRNRSHALSSLLVLLIASSLFIVVTFNAEAGDSCVSCHGDAVKMKEAGHAGLTVTPEEVLSQTRMPAACTDCHLGDKDALSLDEAHKGLLSLRVIGTKWEVFTRKDLSSRAAGSWPALEPRGTKRSTGLMPKILTKGELKDDPGLRLLIYHDRNTGTLAFNPGIAGKTCGRCHAEIVKSFIKTSMGGGKGSHTQSQYKYWTGPTGPQSCGLWVGALSSPDQEAFTDEDMSVFNRHTTMPITAKTGHNSQRTCNQCHVGCLDCHLTPQKKEPGNQQAGPHTFSKRPPALSCYGGGKSFSCHAGPLERRRGDGYLRAEFTQASSAGKDALKDRPDIHAARDIACVDCHEPNKKSGLHADLKRVVDCSKCHAKTAASHRKGPHKKVDCASCHTALIGGYAFNFWTVRGENPITRLQGYMIGATQPLLIKNPGGIWIPVHVVPHTSGNVVADEVKISQRLIFRNRPDSAVSRLYRSNDAYAITGLVRNMDDKDRDTMVWLNLDRVAHSTGRSRPCESCHASQAQRIVAQYEAEGDAYKDVEDGEYTIIADSKGLRITDFRGPDGGPIPKGLEPFKDRWSLKGDFSMPGIKNRKVFNRMKKEYERGGFVH